MLNIITVYILSFSYLLNYCQHSNFFCIQQATIHSEQMATNLFIEKTELAWLLHSSLQFNLLGVQSINNVDLPAFSFSRLDRKANGMETVTYYVCTYSHIQTNTQHTCFCILYEQLSHDQYVIYFTHTCPLSANKGEQLRFLQLHEQTSRRCFIKITREVNLKLLSK